MAIGSTPPAGSGITPSPFSSIADFFGQNPNALQFLQEQDRLQQMFRAANPGDIDDADFIGRSAGATFANALGSAAGIVPSIAFSNLGELLTRQGRSDPGLMNQNLQALSREGATRNQDLTGILTGAGLQGSGVAQAIQAATNLGTASQRANLRNREAQIAEERRRQNLALFESLIGRPAREVFSVGLGQGLGQAQLAQQQQNRERGGLLGFISEAIQAFGLPSPGRSDTPRV